MGIAEFQLVSLHKCKACGVRMFACDRRGHLKRHGIDARIVDVDSHFQTGKRDTCPVVDVSRAFRKPRKQQEKKDSK